MTSLQTVQQELVCSSCVQKCSVTKRHRLSTEIFGITITSLLKAAEFHTGHENGNTCCAVLLWVGDTSRSCNPQKGAHSSSRVQIPKDEQEGKDRYRISEVGASITVMHKTIRTK
jgi:hypothetical protein